MTPRKLTITYNGVPSKGKINNVAGGTAFSSVVDQHVIEDTGSSPQDAIIRRPYPSNACRHEASVSQSDRDRQQVTLDRKRVAHEQKTLKHLNDQL